MLRLIMILTSVFLLAGCVSSRVNNLKVGMTKEEAIGVMGEPDDISAQGREEALYYRDGMKNYYVNIVDGTVESYGRQAPSPAQQQAVMAYLMRSPAPVYQSSVYQMPVNRPVNLNCTTQQSGAVAYTNCH